MQAIIRDAIERIPTGDGHHPTLIPFLSIIRTSSPGPVSRGFLEPSLCLILQGQKRLQLGDQITTYGPGQYLVATVEVPAAGQIVEAPYLGVRISLAAKEIADVVLGAGLETQPAKRAVAGAFVGQGDADLLDALHRLLKLLVRPRDAAFLADGIKREIVYRLLTGPDGQRVYRNVVLDHLDLGVGKAIHWLKHHFEQPVKVEQLAKLVDMSVSSLQHKFKDVTSMGPLQYQKQLRLQEARRLLLTGTVDAATAAHRVGYESQSQFSREYRRLFGAPPIQDTRQQREIGAVL